MKVTVQVYDSLTIVPNNNFCYSYKGIGPANWLPTYFATFTYYAGTSFIYHLYAINNSSSFPIIIRLYPNHLCYCNIEIFKEWNVQVQPFLNFYSLLQLLLLLDRMLLLQVPSFLSISPSPLALSDTNLFRFLPLCSYLSSSRFQLRLLFGQIPM